MPEVCWGPQLTGPHHHLLSFPIHPTRIGFQESHSLQKHHMAIGLPRLSQGLPHTLCFRSQDSLLSLLFSSQEPQVDQPCARGLLQLLFLLGTSQSICGSQRCTGFQLQISSSLTHMWASVSPAQTIGWVADTLPSHSGAVSIWPPSKLNLFWHTVAMSA